MKCLWRFNFEGTSFWRKSTTEKYDLLNEWSSNMGCPPQGVGIWRNIRDLWPAFSANIGIKVGNGSKVSFWKDTKIRHSPLKDQFPICFSIARDTNLTEAQRKEGENWNILLRGNPNEREKESSVEVVGLLTSFKKLNNSEDSLIWKGQRHGRFTVKSRYSLLIRNQYTHGPWKQVWNSKAPVQVMCFVWLVKREAASFQDNLQRRGIQLVNRCYLCGKEEESSNHHFLHCSFTLQIW